MPTFNRTLSQGSNLDEQNSSPAVNSRKAQTAAVNDEPQTQTFAQDDAEVHAAKLLVVRSHCFNLIFIILYDVILAGQIYDNEYTYDTITNNSGVTSNPEYQRVIVEGVVLNWLIGVCIWVGFEANVWQSSNVHNLRSQHAMDFWQEPKGNDFCLSLAAGCYLVSVFSLLMWGLFSVSLFIQDESLEQLKRDEMSEQFYSLLILKILVHWVVWAIVISNLMYLKGKDLNIDVDTLFGRGRGGGFDIQRVMDGVDQVATGQQQKLSEFQRQWRKLTELNSMKVLEKMGDKDGGNGRQHGSRQSSRRSSFAARFSNSSSQQSQNNSTLNQQNQKSLDNDGQLQLELGEGVYQSHHSEEKQMEAWTTVENLDSPSSKFIRKVERSTSNNNYKSTERASKPKNYSWGEYQYAYNSQADIDQVQANIETHLWQELGQVVDLRTETGTLGNLSQVQIENKDRQRWKQLQYGQNFNDENDEDASPKARARLPRWKQKKHSVISVGSISTVWTDDDSPKYMNVMDPIQAINVKCFDSNVEGKWIENAKPAKPRKIQLSLHEQQVQEKVKWQQQLRLHEQQQRELGRQMRMQQEKQQFQKLKMGSGGFRPRQDSVSMRMHEQPGGGPCVLYQAQQTQTQYQQS